MEVPSDDGEQYLAVSARSSSDVWLVGYGGPAFHTFAVHWDGSAGKSVSTPALPTRSNILFAVGGSGADDVWAIGVGHPGSGPGIYPIAEHWDGNSWSIAKLATPPGTAGALEAIAAIGPNDVWSVGWSGSNREHRSLIEHWDGTRWNVVPVSDGGDPPAELSSISAVSANDVWAAGRAHFTNVVLHWNGTAWRRVDVPPLAFDPPGEPRLRSYMRGIFALAKDDLWIATMGHQPDRGFAPYFVHWDGRTWTGGRVPLPPNAGVEINEIGGNRSSGLWAVGYGQGEGAVMEPVIYHLDGGSWKIAASPSIPPAPRHRDDFRMNELVAVSAARNGEVWAVGTHFTSASPDELPLVERYCPPG